MQPRITLFHFLLIAFGILACAFALEIFLAPSVGQKPDIEKALDDFSARYPEAAVNDIRIMRDDAKARSFEFDYRNKASGNVGRLEVQYVIGGDGKWGIWPEPPARLP